MSKQLAVASAFSVFAMSALALLAPDAARVPGSSVEQPTGVAPLLAGDFVASFVLLD